MRTHQTDVTLDSGVFVFSWDFELAWGFHDLQTLPEQFRSSNTRKPLMALIDILESTGVPSTWATVGHLFLDECSPRNGQFHPELPRPHDDWYARDPGTDSRTDPAWYAPDVVDRLRHADSAQEIACHTFSHVTTDVEPTILHAEIEACREQLPDDVPLCSFVSPRHSAVPSDVLREAGITTYRSTDVSGGLLRKARFYAGMAPETGLPECDAAGLWRIPTSTYFFYEPLHQIQRRVPSVKRRWFRAGLRQAAQRNEVFHVWAHPHNFIDDDHAIREFRYLMNRVAAMEADGDLKAMTMGELAATAESAI